MTNGDKENRSAGGKGGREGGEATYVGLGEKREEIKRLKGDDWKKKGEEKQEFEVGR